MKICIPIRAKNVAAIQQKMKAALRIKKSVERSADRHIEIFFELWLDTLTDNEISTLLRQARTPAIVVCRGAFEKGSFKGSEEGRIEKLLYAVKNGARFVDCGVHTAKKLLQKLKKSCRAHGAKLIISEHIWNGTPTVDELLRRAQTGRKLGADIVKIATMAKRWSDNVRLFELAARLSKKGIKNIVIGMGELGKVSRIGCPTLGSFLTYTALDEKSKTAPGQVTVKEISAFLQNKTG